MVNKYRKKYIKTVVVLAKVTILLVKKHFIKQITINNDIVNRMLKISSNMTNKINKNA